MSHKIDGPMEQEQEAHYCFQNKECLRFRTDNIAFKKSQLCMCNLSDCHKVIPLMLLIKLFK